ncbi:sulfatase [Marinoscillum furvescens]|uniref:Putative sulfatase n=1 Tax=Marinoscillum furvescens DSM 4134 TaxID=1122208 RepID=A0A3D9L3V5_MARFU|nr:sulfatase [Marinoscillum furvescens]RED98368.1 putative sulfatase [Marinoscillum furvescens DSM 4134]
MKALFRTALPILLLTAFSACKKPQISQPNIIFILADDYGIMDTQAYAKKFTGIENHKMFYETPNIDRLMNEGVSFSQAYANQLCSPTRASILTGKYAARLGFTTAMPFRDTYYNQNMEVPEGYYAHDVLEHKDDIKIQQALTNGISNSAIPTGTEWDNGLDELTIAEALKDYNSAFIGKWHVGGFGAMGYQPGDNGFEALAWADAGGSRYFDWRDGWNNKSKNRFPNMPQDKWAFGDAGEKTGEDYLTDDLTAQALSYIDRQTENQEKPFFLYFSHFAVHSPIQAPKEDINYFESKDSKGWNGHEDATYAAMIKHLDMSVGAILDMLEEKGIAENTLVVFMSDNGGIDRKITPKGDGTDNAPFFGGKACVTEGGIRVPLIFRWKGQFQEGRWVDEVVDCTDIFPTLASAGGLDEKQLIKQQKLDGQSLLPLISDKYAGAYAKTTRYWHYPFNVIYNSPYDGLPLTPHSAIRDGDFKLIFDWYGRLHLYNIALDPFEKNDLAKANPEMTDKLFDKLINWLEENVDRRYWPSENPDYIAAEEARDTPFVNLYKESKTSTGL